MNRLKFLLLICVLAPAVGAQTTFIDEDFSTGTGTTPPTGWTNNDIASAGDAWQFSNPGARTLNAPITGPAAIFDSDDQSDNSLAEECALESPAFDASSATVVILEFDHYFQGGFGGDAFVEVFNGTAWNQVYTAGGVSTANPDSQSIDISTDAAGVSNAQVRFRWTGDFSWYWIVDNVMVTAPPANDVGVIAVTAPTTGVGLTATEAVTITVENFGSASQSNVPVQFTVNGGTPVMETYAGPIAGGTTDTFTFTATADLSTPSTTYTIVASTSLTGDAVSSNDSTSVDVRHIPTVSTFPFAEDFEGPTAGDWRVTGGTTTWELATPANTVINSAASGSNSWITNATGNYVNNENGAVNSPGFDLSSFTSDPWVSMSVWWEAEFSWDGAVLQSSIDSGASWQNVGADGDPNNWYTDDTIAGLTAGSGQTEGWSGRNGTGATGGSNGWVTALHQLIGLGGQSSVLFRVVFGTDASGIDDGFAFDDFQVGNLAEINVMLGTNSVPHRGSIDVGNINIAGGTATFAIENLGDFGLDLTDSAPDYMTLTPGGNLDSISVTSPPTTPIAGGSSSTFTINIDPTANGAFDFTVSIGNSDTTPVQFASGADGVLTLASSNFSSATANFVAADVGTQIVISGSGSGNDGTYTITAVNSATDVTLGTAPTADEGTLAWSHEGSEDPYTFTVTGTGVTNGSAEADPATGSSFSGPTNGPLTQAVAPGATLANADVELTDPESDTITVTAITPPGTAPTGITAPTIPGAGHPIVLSWTGTADASNPPGDYTWVVEFNDAVNGSTVTCNVTITITDVPPAHTILNATGGDGTSAGTAYTATFAENDTGATSVDLATVSDANTSQTVTLGTVNEGGSNPSTGAFQFVLSGGSLTVAPAGTLAAADVGTHTFDMDISDGTPANDQTIFVSITVFGNSGSITFDQTTLPGGTVGSAYTTTLTVTGAAAGALAWSVISGSLPAGLSLNGVTGEISGTPTTAATSNFTIRVVDSASDSAQQAFSITINTAGGGGGGGGGGDDGGCSTGTDGFNWLALLGLLGVVALGIRMRASKA